MTTKAQKIKAAPKNVAPKEQIIQEEPVMVAPVIEKKELKPEWEIKDRMYYLANGVAPLTFTLTAKHSQRHPLMYFDEKLGYEKELRYATNQVSVFVDEQKGPSTLAHIVFKNGVLMVPKQKQNLQKLLSLYHPQKNKTYKEQDDVAVATDELEDINLEIEALVLAQGLDIDHAEAILRTELGTSVNKMTSKELKRDLMLLAKSNPALFISLANDENVELRSFGIRAVEAGILSISPDQKTFMWASNGKKLMTVPFEEHPYSALASWFKTDEGMLVYKSIEKKFS